MTRGAGWVAVGLLATLSVACGPGQTGGGAKEPRADFAAPPSARATLVFEPAKLSIGEVTVAELAVVTPLGHALAPVAPVELPGLWLLGVRALPVESDGQRLTHRTEFRVRPRELGTHEWPAMTLRVEGPDGGVETLELPASAFEVASVADRFARREEPFGLQAPAIGEGGAGFGLGLAAGLGFSAACALLAFGVRRAVGARRDAAQAEALASREAAPAGLREWSERELGLALEALEREPREAASAGAHLLRVYMSRRFGGNPLAATTEELEAETPSLAVRALWPDFVRILHNLDDVRFRPAGSAGESVGRARIRRALEDSLRLVAASLPERKGDGAE